MANIRWDKVDTVEITRTAYEGLRNENRLLKEENMMLHRRINAMRMAADLQRFAALPEMLTTDQVGEFLQITTARARQMIVDRQLPAIQFAKDGKWYVPRQKLIDFIEEHMITVQEEMPV